MVLAVGATLLVGLGTALVASTGGDDNARPATPEPSQADQYVRHLSAFVNEIGVGTISQRQADCVAERIVDQVWVDRLAELDILHALGDASQAPLVIGTEAQATYRRAFECLDDQALAAFLAGTIQRAILVGPDQAECMVQGWFEGMGRDALVDMYTILSTEGVTSESLESLPPEQRDLLLLDVAAGCTSPAG